ncbi:RluA family pseudouridine synthase [Phreatobacter stygius]|uniref:Ribosomal large subunit pseudouridine synthase D n=1 Tax=Phreatobacter stygius TaxID=1940610 RepID=A0A4D7BHT3_9HYPH|nr:RluA family pseudouridine synthase [Phreatobacter stygius]QCI68656.1 RluA family pseudouridine synthase [Phreatobacter stygius]
MKGKGGRPPGSGSGRPPRKGPPRPAGSRPATSRPGASRPGAPRFAEQRSAPERKRPFGAGAAERPERQGAEDRRPPRGRRPEAEESESRSFDGSPRRRRDSDWDVRDETGWAPEADLDIAGIEEPRRPVHGRPERRDEPRRDEPRRDEPRRESRGGRGAASPGSRDDEGRRPPPRASRDERAPAPPPAGPTKAEMKAAATETLQTGVQTLAITADEDGMRVDRFLAARFPQLSFSYIQRIVRKGELRVNGKRVETKDRLEEGQAVRVPPLKLEQARPMTAKVGEDIKGFLTSITLYEDNDVLVFAKPAGLAVQGGSGTKKHLDGMLAVLTDEDGQRPRLVHRLDKDTSGCILVAKSRFAAAALAKTFRTRSARKIYWAVVAGVPKPRQGRVSTFLAKEEREDESRMRLAKHGEKGASHAVSYYAVIDTMAQKLSWLSMKPVTGRTHQLRVHAAEIGNPIIGDPKYFDVENWEIPGGVQHKLHLHARRLVVPHPRGKGTIDVSAPLPPHMQQTFNLLGWDVSHYDPIVEAPEE